MGFFEKAIGGEDRALDHEVKGEGSHAISHEVTQAVRHEITGQQGDVVRHEVHEVGAVTVRPDPVVVRIEGFSLRLRLFGREIARLDVGPQSPKFSK